MPEVDGSYWDQRWREGDTGWDIGGGSPPLQQYFGQLPDRQLSVLIPGCGSAHEASWLLDNDFTDITLLDIAAHLIGRLREKFAPIAATRPAARLMLVAGDFFTHEGQYDLIVEQTFLCSLDPALRPAYVDQAYRLLRPGGKLAGLLFDRDFSGRPPDGPAVSQPKASHPPYGGHQAEYKALLEKKFTLKTFAPCHNSIKPRAGSELFFIAERPAPAG